MYTNHGPKTKKEYKKKEMTRQNGGQLNRILRNRLEKKKKKKKKKN